MSNEVLLYFLRTTGKDATFLIYAVCFILTLLTGIVAGSDLPLLAKIVERDKKPVTRPIINFLSAEYYGATMGLVLFSFFLYPRFGLVKTVIFSQIITLVLLHLLFFAISGFHYLRRGIVIALLTLNVYVAASYLWHDNLLKFLDYLPSLTG